MSTYSRTLVARYSFSVVTIAATTLLRFLLNPILSTGVPFILYYPAIVLCAWFGGLWAGLLATALSGIIAWYLFLEPRFSFADHSSAELAQLLTFLIAGTLISLLAESLHRSKRKTEESEARERERREELRITLASIGDGVIATDADSKVTFINAVAEALTGETQAAALGKPLEKVFRIINEATRQPAENPVIKVLENGHTVGLANHTILIAKDGAEHPIDDSAAPIRDKNGKLIGVILVFRDISARRREEAMRSHLSSIVESSNDAIISKSLDSTVTSWNKAAENIFGYREAEMLGQPIYKIIPPERHKEEDLIIERLKRDEKIDHFETVRLKKDGTIIDVALTVSPIKNSEGEIIGASKIARDISERKRFEKKLQDLIRRHEETLANIR
ncbi:MAG TPA: PAS domain S-box protein, partial [Blastocatellia bacterium]|nr:PAS domain S-box protein [Blastocatellia bacterium]